MQSDNDLSTARVDLAIDAAENQEDRTVEWLLEQDYADPAEKLFTVADEDVVENAGLTEYEAEIANRPMFGGEGTSDDLSCFVSEEIVLSETGSTDIFGGSESPNAASGSESAVPLGFSMAVDRSGASQVDGDSEANSIEEGFDILGLDEEDDIGERHVVMQKNPAKKRKKTLRAVTTANAPVEKTEIAVSSDATEQAESELAIDIDINQPVSVDLVTTDLGALETEDTEPEISLELPEVELSNEETELEIQNLLTLDAIETEEETELPVAEFDGFLSDSSGFLSQPEDTEVQEISADTEEQPLESIMDDISELQLNLDDELQALDVPTEELVTTSEDESAGFLGAQAMSLALVDDVDNEEQLAVEPMSFDMEPVTLDTAVDEITEAPAVELTEEPVEIALDNNVDLLAELESPELVAFDAVADLEEAPAEDTIELVDNASSEDFGVLDYVAANEPPVDDAEFDQYLLGGEHLEDPDLSLEGLVVDSTEGVVSVDPQLETAIDYHEDFNTEEVLNNDFVTAITGVIADVMEELTVCVDERLRKLSLSPDSVQVEVMLGTDEASMKQCQEENYQPILGLATSKLETLSTLGQAEIDSIYVRLSNIYDDSDWNQLFAEDFVAPSTDIDSESAETPAAFSDKDDFLGGDLSFTDSLAPSEDLSSEKLPEFDQELSAENVFDEEALSEDILAETASPFDIEDDLENSTGQLLDKAQEDSLSQPDASLDDLSFANFDGKDDSVFGEDIFAGDLSEEFAPVDVSAGVDVEALIHSLADAETDIGEICGVSVDQFANTDAANSEDTAKTPDVAVPVPAAEVANSTDGELSWCVPADIQFSHTNQPSTEIFSEFLDAFIEEGASELEKLEDALGEWEKDISNEPAYLPIPRILHTLKGIAKGVGLQRYGTLIHNFETLLDSLDRPEVGQQAAYFRIVNGWLDASAKGFEHIEQERTDITSELPTHSSAPVLDKVKPAVAEEVAPLLPVSVQTLSEDSPVVAIADSVDDSHKDKQLADEGAKVLAAQQTIRMTPEALDRLLSLTNEAQQLGVRSSQATVRSKRSAAELLTRLSSVRAHVSKIAERTLLNVTAKGGQAASTMDALEMDQYSELQEAANFLREGVEDLDDLIHLSSRQNTVAEALLKQQASIISSLGSSIQAARVIPVSRLMPGLRRIVRTVSADLGKSVSFRVLNEVGTLDRDNHARCQIILEHMTRNALDHGIETPEVRAAAGKDTTGSITIEASKLGSDYIVTLSDDGKGIDPEFMRDMAYEKGLDIDVDKLTDEEAIRLIFHKGFSTATVVSEISGRGVGMDIVLSELQHIGGDIEIESTVGVGTTFKVRIPSNVTVNGALLVAAGEVSYAVPLDGLIAVEHVPVDVFYDAIRDNSQLTLFGMDCDPAYLATICHGDSLPDRSSWNTTVPVIIAGSESRYMAIAIDDVTQALELVIRSLGAQFSMIPGLAGGATTADGKSIVALDLNALVESSPTDELSPVSMRTEREERMLVLVVDDSRTQRMVATSQFDNLGVETVTAENGLVAIDLLNTTHRLPDVILLDIEMPVKDGIQTLREIRKSTRYSDLPVIMVTSRTGAKHRALAEDAGCNGYMGKPFNFPKLVEQIADLTNHKFQLS